MEGGVHINVKGNRSRDDVGSVWGGLLGWVSERGSAGGSGFGSGASILPENCEFGVRTAINGGLKLEWKKFVKGESEVSGSSGRPEDGRVKTTDKGSDVDLNGTLQEEDS